MKIHCPRCPLCDQQPDPRLPLYAQQAFCGSPECKVMSWDPSRTLDQNLTTINFIELPPDLFT